MVGSSLLSAVLVSQLYLTTSWQGHLCQRVFWLKYRATKAFVRRCSVKKVFLTVSQNLQEKVFTRVSFSIKLQAILLKNRVCFPVNFAKLLRNPFLQNTYSDCFWSYQTHNSRAGRNCPHNTTSLSYESIALTIT